ncbi:MAG: OmpH family outer membrane protein [Alistipes sp.]|nr:OmpH family outer membrane protein [Alistipes sp.]
MKRLILAAMAVVFAAGAASAQNVITVDSEKIFKSIDSYNTALKTIDELGEQYQRQVDAKFQEVENLYNNYVNNQRPYLSESARTARENEILTKEEEATKFQEGIFGQNGTLMQKRVELIKPIQERVFAAIEKYAAANGVDLVVDKAANPTLLYESKSIDRTQAIIDAMKQ